MKVIDYGTPFKKNRSLLISSSPGPAQTPPTEQTRARPRGRRRAPRTRRYLAARREEDPCTQPCGANSKSGAGRRTGSRPAAPSPPSRARTLAARLRWRGRRARSLECEGTNVGIRRRAVHHWRGLEQATHTHLSAEHDGKPPVHVSSRVCAGMQGRVKLGGVVYVGTTCLPISYLATSSCIWLCLAASRCEEPSAACSCANSRCSPRT